jgi:hypothetical protein
MIDFDNIKMIKKIGTGMYGTAYLVEYKKQNFALKVQKILEEETTKNYNYEIWREIDVYNYIDKLDKDDQIFFTKLFHCLI